MHYFGRCLDFFGLVSKPLTFSGWNREESEKVSELKSVSGSSKLPYGTLASGSEGIKDAITGFDDAYVNHLMGQPTERPHMNVYTDASRISRTSVSLPSFLMPTQKKAKPLCPNPLPPPKIANPCQHPSLLTVSRLVSKLPFPAAPSFRRRSIRLSPPLQLLSLDPLFIPRLALEDLGAAIRDKRAWVRR